MYLCVFIDDSRNGDFQVGLAREIFGDPYSLYPQKTNFNLEGGKRPFYIVEIEFFPKSKIIIPPIAALSEFKIYFQFLAVRSRKFLV